MNAQHVWMAIICTLIQTQEQRRVKNVEKIVNCAMMMEFVLNVMMDSI